ncbi:hypothetical protein GOP47_0024491 [Adiantum capillus-veneris]|uniref:C3H1-type domain-containing protein n=1 Tax=Adiantum capillus-veneris TaxID=13818 RepID=A0A9D4Z535_ADICA|nr:hypothetical protein GOP47_0024491 [Adiantum capillus-veneris]
MPVGKYYCDYCDKQFQDTPAARRRHLQGVLHQRNKKAWFDSFQEPAHQQAAVGQKVCLQFMRTGVCHYGTRCRFQHVTSQSQHGAMKDVTHEYVPPAFLNLPPSLRPPDSGYWHLPQVDWG